VAEMFIVYIHVFRVVLGE